MSFKFDKQNIGISFSGGGVRAAAFHAGVLKWMAERDVINRVAHISSVSGGSLFVGLVFKLSNYQWPNKSQYLQKVYPQILECLTTTSLQTNALCQLIFNPICWRYILSRAQVVARCIESSWRINSTLKQLPKYPLWTINGTTAENGRRFRFKGTRIGDYKFGYAEAKNYKISIAMAVSAAFPGGIGPIILKTNSYQWRKKTDWNASEEKEISPEFGKLHLYDGGVYDNLGLEPLFDIGRQELKFDEETKVNFIIVSDAGAAYGQKSIPGPLNIGRLKRVADVAFDQCRALRIRSYVNFLQKNTEKGMYIQIGFNPIDHISKNKNIDDDYKWLDIGNIRKAAQYPTTLKKMSSHAFENLARHGYETARANELAYLK